MSQRIDIQKTYKLFIGGKFPRTESGRYIKWTDKKETTVVNICRGSRKDFRNAMVSARSASSGWSSRTAYNRAQILFLFLILILLYRKQRAWLLPLRQMILRFWDWFPLLLP
jgi:acyl-CoA reductase-like NAD-dependent aldehyde dehydrogenase